MPHPTYARLAAGGSSRHVVPALCLVFSVVIGQMARGAWEFDEGEDVQGAVAATLSVNYRPAPAAGVPISIDAHFRCYRDKEFRRVSGRASTLIGSIMVTHEADNYGQVSRWASALLGVDGTGFARLGNPAPAPKDESRGPWVQYARQSMVEILVPNEGFAEGWVAFTAFCGTP